MGNATSNVDFDPVQVLGCTEAEAAACCADAGSRPGEVETLALSLLPVVAAPARPALLLGHHQPGRPDAARWRRAWSGGCSTRAGCRTSCTQRRAG